MEVGQHESKILIEYMCLLCLHSKAIMDQHPFRIISFTKQNYYKASSLPLYKYISPSLIAPRLLSSFLTPLLYRRHKDRNGFLIFSFVSSHWGLSFPICCGVCVSKCCTSRHNEALQVWRMFFVLVFMRTFACTATFIVVCRYKWQTWPDSAARRASWRSTGSSRGRG